MDKFKTSSPTFGPCPEWLKNAIFYQIYPQSFKDSNGDGIGDLRGIIEKADYLGSLGIDAVWFNPIYPSPFRDAGYDVNDFYNIAPRYGTLEDFKELLFELKKRNIRVVLDLVAGHTSIDCPWFIESATAEKNDYSDRYIWTDSTDEKPGNFVDGSHYPRTANYLKNFFDSQPALNYGYTRPKQPWQQPVDAPGPQATRVELKKIMAFWLDLGVDGFRVDMASSLVKNDPDQIETKKLWREFRLWLENSYPDAVLIAEWGDPEQAIDAGFHVDFLIHFGASEYESLFFNEGGTLKRENCFFDRRGNGTSSKFVENYLAHKSKIEDRGYISVPTANHDFQRPAAGPRRGDELKVAMMFFLTWPGLPVIYYGDEIGMRFIEDLPDKEGSVYDNTPVFKNRENRAGSRTPMQWDESRNAGFSTVKEAEKLYLPIDPDSNRPNVQSQESDPESLLNFTRRLIQLRKQSKTLGNVGEMIPLFAEENRYPLIYLRQFADERYLICLNPAERVEAADIEIEDVSTFEDVLSSGVELKSGKSELSVTMQSVSWGLFKLE